MKTSANNTQESNQVAIANDPSKKQDLQGAAIQFTDNRPEAFTQRKLQDMADQSLQVNKAFQLQAMADKHVLQQKPVQKKKHDTGLPDQLKAGIENLSGYSMDAVKVHYNSDKPAQLYAHAFAQGNDIHLASGQEKHLPHEAWHVVQQKQGRVQPTMQMKGNIPVNDDAGLEQEADMMGARAHQLFSTGTIRQDKAEPYQESGIQPATVQAYFSDAQGMLRSIFIGHVTKFVNDLYPDNAEMQNILEAFVARANSETDEGSANDFLVSHGLSPSVIDRYVTFGIKPVVSESQHSSPHSEHGASASAATSKPSGDVTSDMILRAITAASQLHEQLNEVMAADETFEYSVPSVSPQDQLKQCLKDCADMPAEKIAIYLYTTYFYSPLNKFLRGDTTVKASHEAIVSLIEITHKLLMQAFADTPAQVLIPKFRMELLPGWIGKKGVGDELSLPGYTSTHPELAGVNSMWPNIESGAFGKHGDRLALLVFEGKSKFIEPEDKYFRNEVEHILPPGTIGKIVKKYETRWTDPKSKKVWVVDVYHLMILPQSQAPSGKEFHFGKDGFIRSAQGKSSQDDAKESAPASSAGSSRPATEYHIDGEDVDAAIVESVGDYLRHFRYETTRRITVVSGENWTCYIICVLLRLGKTNKYDAVMQAIANKQKINLNSGVTVGGAQEAAIQAIIEEETGVQYYVTATDVSHGHAAVSANQHGTPVEVILTGAHFSLLR